MATPFSPSEAFSLLESLRELRVSLEVEQQTAQADVAKVSIDSFATSRSQTSFPLFFQAPFLTL
jgi:hypothetical protein